MKGSSRQRVLPWTDVFELRYNEDSTKPLHVQVVDVGPGVQHVRQGDELFLHDIISDEISLKRSTNSLTATEHRRLSGPLDGGIGLNDDLEILLPRQYGAGFTLCPRHPLSHCFQSVREIIDALPAVSRIFYPVDGLCVREEQVKPMERLEILQQIRDPFTGMDMLSVRSMKTEAGMLLPADLRAQFVQLSNDCFKCGPNGIKAFECITSWKPGQPPFQVKLCPRRTEEKTATLKVPKQSKLKRDKKDKKKKHSSCSDFENFTLSDFQGESDAQLIPESWRDKPLFMKPFQKVRVQNVMFNARHFFLPENAKLTVKVLSADPASLIEMNSSIPMRDRIPSVSSSFSGPLRQLPPEMQPTSRRPLLLLVTEGEMAISLRQQLKISQGTRLAVRRVQETKKILMECEREQKFIVGPSYAGLFSRLIPTLEESNFPIDHLSSCTFPCKVQVIKEDRSLGYDQLSRRRSLTAVQELTDFTLFVEVFGGDGRILSEQPFEIPMQRTNFSVKVIDGNSVNLSGSVSLKRLRLLPSVEFITDAQIEILKTPPTNEMHAIERSLEALSPEFPIGISGNLDIQQVKDIYSSPSKGKYKDGNAASGIPPPRPPKSANISQPKVSGIQTNYGPPDLPPKPDRYRDLPIGFSFNTNQNSKNGHDPPPIPLSERLDGDFNLENPNAATSLRALPPKPRNSSFQKIHSSLDPGGFNAQELVKLDEAPPVPEKLFGDIDIHGNNDKDKEGNGVREAVMRVRRGKHGKSIANPNYEEKLGDEIVDSAFERLSLSTGEQPDYEFAQDVS